MQIAILGTGAVGPALAKALSAAGDQVTIGTRDPEIGRASCRERVCELV